MWSDWKYHTLLVEMQKDDHFAKQPFLNSYRLIPACLSLIFTQYRDLYTNVHSSFLSNSQKMETTKTNLLSNKNIPKVSSPTWINLRITMLNERSLLHYQKYTYCVDSLL